MALLTIHVSNAQQLIEKVRELMEIYRRFTPHRYIACMTSDGVTFVPLVSSRHAHTITLAIVKDDDGSEYEKALEMLKKIGFKVYENCHFRPETT